MLDALTAAQIEVGLLTATMAQQIACDVEPNPRDGDIDVLDSLVLAQVSSGLPASLGCFPIVVAPEGYGVPGGVLQHRGDPQRSQPRHAQLQLRR